MTPLTAISQYRQSREWQYGGGGGVDGGAVLGGGGAGVDCISKINLDSVCSWPGRGRPNCG